MTMDASSRRAAWRGADVANERDWVHRLTGTEVDELRRAVELVHSSRWWTCPFTLCPSAMFDSSDRTGSESTAELLRAQTDTRPPTTLQDVGSRTFRRTSSPRPTASGVAASADRP